jgi:mono/diheme cytochrome c family protein
MFSDAGSRGLGRMRVWAGLGLGLVALLAGGCDGPVTPLREWTPADHGHDPEPDPSRLAAPTNSAPEQGGPARAAAALWMVTCASCHGRGGQGDGPKPPPGAQLPDLTRPEFQAARSDAQLAESIRTGRGMMPAFADKLSPEAVTLLVAHVRGLAAPAAAAPASAPDPVAPAAVE